MNTDVVKAMQSLRGHERRYVDAYVISGKKPIDVMRELYPDITYAAAKQRAKAIMRRPHVIDAIKAAEDDAIHTARVRRSWVVNRLRQIASANLFGADGKPLAVDELDDDTRASVSSLEYDVDGEGTSYVKRIRLYSAIDALKELAIMAGLKREQVQVSDIGPGLTVIVHQSNGEQKVLAGPGHRVPVNLPEPQ